MLEPNLAAPNSSAKHLSRESSLPPKDGDIDTKLIGSSATSDRLDWVRY